ncbi:MAG: threonine synthase [Candidatus Lokiarchaeota archaeon]|nr:threonine synthase [Candidatus Lokiarchaeota archaeon]
MRLIKIILEYKCSKCSNQVKSEKIECICPKCEGLLFIEPQKVEIININELKIEKGDFWKFHKFFPPIEKKFRISLGEGGTNCIKSKNLGKALGLNNLFLKDETQNPTNSFKDRAGALLVSHAKSQNYEKIISASAGNQGASIAAYSSYAGIECLNIIPKRIDEGKRAQMYAYDSVVEIKGDTVDESIIYAEKKSKEVNFYQATAELNPLTIEAQKTIGYEIIGDIGVPDWLIVPMGSGGCLISIWKGLNELKELGVINELPKMVGAQVEGWSPIVDKYSLKKHVKSSLKVTHTLGILVKNPRYKDLAAKIIKASNGEAITINENLILTAERKLARSEGIFAEPASALTVASVEQLKDQNIIDKNEKICCLITGSGLKAPYVLQALTHKSKTVGIGALLSTKLKILQLIELDSMYGTQIQKNLGDISLPAVYQHLSELEIRDLIAREKKQEKRIYYNITPKGKKVLEAIQTLVDLF